MVENYQILKKPFLDGSLILISVACLYGHRLLGLDGYSSHATANFDHLCMKCDRVCWLESAFLAATWLMIYHLHASSRGIIPHDLRVLIAHL